MRRKAASVGGPFFELFLQPRKRRNSPHARAAPSTIPAHATAKAKTKAAGRHEPVGREGGWYCSSPLPKIAQPPVRLGSSGALLVSPTRPFMAQQRQFHNRSLRESCADHATTLLGLEIARFQAFSFSIGSPKYVFGEPCLMFSGGELSPQVLREQCSARESRICEIQPSRPMA